MESDQEKPRQGWIIYEEVGVTVYQQKPAYRIERPPEWTDEQWDQFVAEMEKLNEK